MGFAPGFARELNAGHYRLFHRSSPEYAVQAMDEPMIGGY
jgi:hypothetical protein